MWRALILLLAIGALVLITTRWNRWESNSRRQSTDDAYLQSDLTPISAKVAGYVRSMPVQDFERVQAGQVLAEIVDDGYRATVDQLTASVAAAAAQIEALKEQLLEPIVAKLSNAALLKEISWAANEAAALAWCTICPILVLPTLLEEKVRAAFAKWEKQQRLRPAPEKHSNCRINFACLCAAA